MIDSEDQNKDSIHSVLPDEEQVLKDILSDIQLHVNSGALSSILNENAHIFSRNDESKEIHGQLETSQEGSKEGPVDDTDAIDFSDEAELCSIKKLQQLSFNFLDICSNLQK